MWSDMVISYMLTFYLPHPLLVDPADLILVTHPILLYVFIHAAINLSLCLALVTSLGVPH